MELTPFKWLLRLDQPLHISSVVLLELINRWCIADQSFRIREFFVSFSPFDVCITLGLWVTGEEVTLKYGDAPFMNSLFNGSEITINLVLAKLHDPDVNKDENVEDFCRLYIILALGTFYFPWSSITINALPFHLLQNVHNLNMYNWGAAVHNFSIQSLNRAVVLYNQQQNTVAVNLSGCVVVLQVSINHFTMEIIVRMFVLQTMCLFEIVMGRTTCRIGMQYRISKNAWK